MGKKYVSQSVGGAAARVLVVDATLTMPLPDPESERRESLPRPPSVTYADNMSVPADDSALMLRYADGDVAAFETLYQRHNDSLYRYLLRLCNNRDTAADLFQDAWSKIIKARHRYRPSAKFTTYLYRVAHNTFIDHLRRNKRYSDGPADDPDLRASEAEGPDVQTEKSLAHAQFLKALTALPIEQRDAFLLHEEAALTIDQIASVTGVPHETAKSRLRYANSKLREAMTEYANRGSADERPATQQQESTP